MKRKIYGNRAIVVSKEFEIGERTIVGTGIILRESNKKFRTDYFFNEDGEVVEKVKEGAQISKEFSPLRDKLDYELAYFLIENTFDNHRNKKKVQFATFIFIVLLIQFIIWFF